MGLTGDCSSAAITSIIDTGLRAPRASGPASAKTNASPPKSDLSSIDNCPNAVSAPGSFLRHSHFPRPTSDFSRGEVSATRAALNFAQVPPDRASPGPTPGPSPFLPGVPRLTDRMPKLTHLDPPLPTQNYRELRPVGAPLIMGDGAGHTPPLSSPGNTFHRAPQEVRRP